MHNPNCYVSLIHYPVINKKGETIASAITNLDLHDIARACRTFGVKKFYVITPLKDQKILAQNLISHWTKGFGAAYNPKRKKALETIQIKDSLEQAIEDVSLTDQKPITAATCAAKKDRNIDCSSFKKIINCGRPCMLLFGTAWGLSKDIIDKADYILEPIIGNTDYNHLSVRSAVAVILDRLMGCRETDSEK